MHNRNFYKDIEAKFDKNITNLTKYDFKKLSTSIVQKKKNKKHLFSDARTMEYFQNHKLQTEPY